MKSHREIITAFGGSTALASIINARPGTVQQWKTRNSIPPAYFADIIAAAPDHGVEITWEQLHSIKKETAQ